MVKLVLWGDNMGSSRNRVMDCLLYNIMVVTSMMGHYRWSDDLSMVAQMIILMSMI